jgi:hypothetical protein
MHHRARHCKRKHGCAKERSAHRANDSCDANRTQANIVELLRSGLTNGAAKCNAALYRRSIDQEDTDMEHGNCNMMGIHATLAARMLPAAAVALAAAGAANGAVVAQWSMDRMSLASDNGVGNGSVVNTNTARWDRGATRSKTDRAVRIRDFDSSGTGADSGREGIEFTVAGGGYQDLGVSWKQKVDARASAWGQLQYAIGDGSFTTDGLAGDGIFKVTTTGKYAQFSFDLSALGIVGEGEDLQLRIVAITDPNGTGYRTTGRGAYRSTGAWSIDSLMVTGSPAAAIPAPAVGALVALAGAAGTRRRQRTR